MEHLVGTDVSLEQTRLQWPGAIPYRAESMAPPAPSDSVTWRPRADHGQKRETGGWMHSGA